MEKTTIQINKVQLENFQPKQETTDIKVTYQKNNEEKTITENIKLKDPYNITRKLLIKIKSKGKFIVEEESDNILENIYVTQLLNEEQVEEQLLLFFRTLCQKIQILRTKKIAKEYLKQIDQIKTEKLIL